MLQPYDVAVSSPASLAAFGGDARNTRGNAIETKAAGADATTDLKEGGNAPGAGKLAALSGAGDDTCHDDPIACVKSEFAKSNPNLRGMLLQLCRNTNEDCEIKRLCKEANVLSQCVTACVGAGLNCSELFPPDPPPITVASSPGTEPGGDPGGGPGAGPYRPAANRYGEYDQEAGSGSVYNANGDHVLSYTEGGDPRDGFYNGLVTSPNGDIVGTFYTNQDGVSGGTVVDNTGATIYTYDNFGNVTTCPCPPF
ncbi:MAG: hypothetical protein HY925_14370 [Elusimicrobia bacterium]|nr:hypothetical protein [Elusimicrobiota bacterium]